MFEVNLTSNYVPIGSKSSYPVQKFLLGAFLLGPKVPIGRVPIGLTDEFIGLKNSSQSARFWFLFGAFLLGAPPVIIFDFAHFISSKFKQSKIEVILSKVFFVMPSLQSWFSRFRTPVRSPTYLTLFFIDKGK